MTDTIAMRIGSGFRDLEGILHRLHAFTNLGGGVLSLKDLELILREFYSASLHSIPKLSTIVRIVVREFHIGKEEILSATRIRKIVRARQVTMYLARKLCGLSYKEIGEYFGNRTHSSVLAAEKKVVSRMKADMVLKQKITQLIDRIRNA